MMMIKADISIVTSDNGEKLLWGNVGTQVRAGMIFSPGPAWCTSLPSSLLDVFHVLLREHGKLLSGI